MKRKGTKGVPLRSGGAADASVGRLIRLRRIEMHMSQQELAERLGLSFQQVQKYEKGTNRVSAGRLQVIAKALDVGVGFFYGDGDKKNEEVNTLLFKDASFSLRMLRAYNAIANDTLRRKMVDLMETLAEGQTGAPA
jgi:transcriptional regulator with XRE-family HTH domain